jgi:hypothetical protein
MPAGFRGPKLKDRYWLTPNGVYAPLNEEFSFDFDPCPCPKPDGYNSLSVEWGKMNYVNPPFRREDGNGVGPTAFARKAIEEKKNGKSSVLLLPVQSYVNLLLEAGAELRSLGRVKWIEVETGKECPHPSPTCCFVLRA